MGVMKRKLKILAGSFVAEAVVYGALVTAYFFLVLHFLGGWLYDLFRNDRRTYALVALVLIVGQGYVLELVTRGLLRLIWPEGKE